MKHPVYYSGGPCIKESFSPNNSTRILSESIVGFLQKAGWNLVSRIIVGNDVTYRLDSKTSPDGLSVRVLIIDDGYTEFYGTPMIRIKATDPAETYGDPIIKLTSLVITYQILASPYQFFIFSSIITDWWSVGMVGILAGTSGQLFWSIGNNWNYFGTESFRTSLKSGRASSSLFSGTYVNYGDHGDILSPYLLAMRRAILSTTLGANFPCGCYMAYLPAMCFGADKTIKGYLYDAYILSVPVPKDTLITVDKHNWQCITANYKYGSLFINIGPETVGNFWGYTY